MSEPPDISKEGAPRLPQIFDADDPRLRLDVSPATTEKAEIGGEMAVPSRPRRIATVANLRRGWSWGMWLVSSAIGLFVMAAVLRFWTFVWDLFLRNDWIGWLAVGLGAIVVLSATVLLVREAVGLFMLARILRLRQSAEAAYAEGTQARSKSVLQELKALYAGRPELAWPRAELAEHDRAILTGPERLALFDRVLMASLDDQAVATIAQSARRVSVVTAITPFAALDMGFVLYENLRMLRRIATVYGGRPGYAAMFRLAGRVLGHVVATGGLAMTDDLFGQFVGQGLAKRLSARAGAGMFNGGLTARLGIAAIDLSRPMPFIEAKKPRFRDLAVEIGRGLTRGKTEAGNEE